MQKKTLGLISTAAISALFGTAIAATGDTYTWPTYRSDLDYDTKSNIGVISAPTNFSTDCDGVTGQKAGKWWAFYWGSNRDSRVTDETIDSLLKKYDTDFAYLRDTMGWAPDRRAQAGYYSAVYYYGSGTCAGGSTTDTTGGWQTNIGTNYYEAVAASLYPVYSFNPKCPYYDRVSQMDAMVHEGIHSMTKAYPGATNAHWFQEGGNTWIQQEMAARRNPNETWHSGMGFLNAGAVIAPFIPIESYSGWLLDGSFGGPNADGVGVYSGSTQLCNWRNLLGGYQYGNVFPTFLGEWVGKGAVRWLYGNAYGTTNYLLETFALDKGLGADNTRRLIMEYRARLALLDMKKWSENMRTLLNDNFGGSASAEWTPSNGSPAAWTMTPYQTMTASGEWLVPESRTTPGWSGANIVPLTVSSGASSATVTFKPLGDNMTIQLCYRKTDGTPVYSEPLTGVANGSTGDVTLNLSNVQSGVIFAVICNTDYQYTGNESIRQNHYNYNIKLTSGLSGAASANTKWYDNFVLTYNWPELGDSYSPNLSSSSTTTSSSSVASSSSYEYVFVSSSSQEVSSSSVAATLAQTFNISVSLPISSNYTGVTVDLNAESIASALGISTASLASGVTYFAQEPNGSFNTTSTAVAPGHWFRKDGSTTSWGSSSYIYSQFTLGTTSTALIGNYPDSTLSAGQTCSFKQGLMYNNQYVLFNFTVTLADSTSSATTVVESSSSAAVESSSSSDIESDVADTTTYAINVTLPIDEQYTAIKLTLNSSALANTLGLTTSTLSNADFYAINPDGSKITEKTANDYGHWFNKDGKVTEWSSDDSYIYSEISLTNNSISIGHYPNRVSDGDVATFIQAFENGNKVALYKFTVTITSDSANTSSEIKQESSSSSVAVSSSSEATVSSSSETTVSSSSEATVSSSSETAVSSSSSSVTEAGSSSSSEMVESSSSSEETPTWMLNTANGPAKHLSLDNNHGILVVNYTLDRRDNVKISLYTGYGALVYVDISEIQSAGTHQKQLNLSEMGLPLGTYILKVTTGTFRETKSITVAK